MGTGGEGTGGAGRSLGDLGTAPPGAGQDRGEAKAASSPPWGRGWDISLRVGPTWHGLWLGSVGQGCGGAGDDVLQSRWGKD